MPRDAILAACGIMDAERAGGVVNRIVRVLEVDAVDAVEGRLQRVTDQEDARLTAEGSDSGDLLGSSVALSDDGVTAVAGTNRASGAAGFVLVFEDRAGALGDTWEGVAALYEPDAASGEANAFGTAVALVGSTLLVGAPTATAFGVPSAGTAYVFEQSPGLSTSASMVTLNTTYVATSTPSVVFTPHTMTLTMTASTPHTHTTPTQTIMAISGHISF